MAGVIRLYQIEGDVFVTQHTYNVNNEMKKVIATWKKLYGPKFNSFYLQIKPTVDASKVKVNGENIKGKNQYSIK